MKLNRRSLAGIALCSGLLACGAEPTPLHGTLEWDRVTVLAEAAEPVLAWHVAEGDRVEAGAVLLELDPRRAEAQLAQASAALAGARAAREDAEREYRRSLELKRQQLASPSTLDRARAARDQAIAGLDSSTAAQQEAQLHHARMTVRAPRAGVVDSLPFKPGDQPTAGAVVASVLAGEGPYVRLFVPASVRAQVAAGTRLQVRVQGVSQSFAAVVRSVRSEPGFTPYYALSGDDASRLAYRAEAVLQGEGTANLPAGLPVTAVFDAAD